jgi:hypothetical protein
MKEIPVIYQYFENEAQEYAHLTADNAIASWASIDLSMVNTEMLDLGPDFDIDMLGIEKFCICPEDLNLDATEFNWLYRYEPIAPNF